jgi:hypothetical protein
VNRIEWLNCVQPFYTLTINGSKYEEEAMTEAIWIPGVNCDVILKHRNHADLPLILHKIPSDLDGPRVRIHYEVYWPDSNSVNLEPIEVRHLWFTVLIADRMLCPDGSWYMLSSNEIQKRLNAILLEKTNIRLTTRTGTIQGLCCEEHAVIHTIYQQAEKLEIHLTTRVMVDIPLESTESLWLETEELRSTWGAAIWG